jgi:hypothetical protein
MRDKKKIWLKAYSAKHSVLVVMKRVGEEKCVCRSLLLTCSYNKKKT